MAVCGAVTNGETFSISYSDKPVRNVLHADFLPYFSEYKIPYFLMKNSMKDIELVEWIQKLNPEFILVAGWYHMIPEEILTIAPTGGLHASLLPDYSGGAPLVWAIINGEKKTGISFFLFNKNVDSGLIIGQREEEISDDDDIGSLYQRIEVKGLELLKTYLPRIINGTVEYREQDESKRRIMPQRTPDDGLIDLNLPGKKLYDFIRAQAPPYPGAFFKTIDGKKLIIEKARLED